MANGRWTNDRGQVKLSTPIKREARENEERSNNLRSHNSLQDLPLNNIKALCEAPPYSFYHLLRVPPRVMPRTYGPSGEHLSTLKHAHTKHCPVVQKTGRKSVEHSDTHSMHCMHQLLLSPSYRPMTMPTPQMGSMGIEINGSSFLGDPLLTFLAASHLNIDFHSFSYSPYLLTMATAARKLETSRQESTQENIPPLKYFFYLILCCYSLQALFSQLNIR